MASHVTVAVHQPNFLPWLGWFDKLVRADVFILLDDAQFPRRGAGTWVNRVMMMIGGRPGWVTVPVARASGTQLITEMQMDRQSPWRVKLARTLQMNYGRHPFASETFALLEPDLLSTTSGLCEYNVALLQRIAGALGIAWAEKVVRASALGVRATATERLIGLVKAAGGTTYVTGGGASSYQEDAKFSEAGLSVDYQNFAHPEYAQRGQQTFTPGLSIVDALMNTGAGGVREMLRRA
jgi:hypothetical protein